MSLSGRIARRRATLYRDEADRLLLQWRDSLFDLEHTVVRHRDDDGDITFTVHAPGGAGLGARYRRRGRRLRDEVWGAIDFMADEPWTWEDRDFGLRVFHVATGTGPVKYRHRIEARDEKAALDHADERRLVVTEEGISRERWGGRAERVRFSDLLEIRVKFELAGVWAESSVLVFHTDDDLAVVPLGYSKDTELAYAELLPRLRRLQGWGRDSELAFEDACEYALRQKVGPTGDEDPASRAERLVWSTP